MIITHYFTYLHQDRVLSSQELFASITEYSIQEQQIVAARLVCSSGRALRRFDQLEKYLQRRIQTEQWLYSSFLEMGGRPVSYHPFYFILGKNEDLKHDFGPYAGELTLDTTLISEYDVSFTLGDSIGLYFSSAQKRLYSLDEIKSISQNITYVQRQMEPLEHYHRYIEVQLWNKDYLSKAQIIEYYPYLSDFTITGRKIPELFYRILHLSLSTLFLCEGVSQTVWTNERRKITNSYQCQREKFNM